MRQQESFNPNEAIVYTEGFINRTLPCIKGYRESSCSNYRRPVQRIVLCPSAKWRYTRNYWSIGQNTRIYIK